MDEEVPGGDRDEPRSDTPTGTGAAASDLAAAARSLSSHAGHSKWRTDEPSAVADVRAVVAAAFASAASAVATATAACAAAAVANGPAM